MGDFLWLDQTGWSAISAIASAATFFGGLVAVVAAFAQLRNAQQLHVEQVRPYIVVDIEPNPAWWKFHDLVIRNIGQTAAVDCRITIDPTPERAGETPRDALGNAKVLNAPIALLAPGREIRLFFDSIDDRIKTDLPMLYTAAVSYASHATGERWTETYTLDVAALMGTENIEIYSTHHLAKALREIQDALLRSPLLKGNVEAVTEDRADRMSRLKTEREERLSRLKQAREPRQEQQQGGDQSESA